MRKLLTSCALFLALSPLATAQLPLDGLGVERPYVEVLDDGRILTYGIHGLQTFGSWNDYVNDGMFQDYGLHCAAVAPRNEGQIAYATTGDCTSSSTNPSSEYAPNGGTLYRIPVVVHILQSPNGQGAISDARVFSQIDVLNEDFGAIGGSPGGLGNDARIEFYLATTDPSGSPSTGINRYSSKKWFQDQGNYAASIGWDTTRYLNIYTNTASGNLGYAYVPNSGGVVGSSFDGVRILYSAFGLNAPIGYPYDEGRTATHEVGHYLGLYHTFQGGCASASGCYSNGDLICDTNPEASPNSFPCSNSSCGSPDPTTNYMDYSYDTCMTEFTAEQNLRMRCTLTNWRVDLAGDSTPVNQAPSVVISAPTDGAQIASGASTSLGGSANDAEDGGLSSSIQWSSSLDGNLGSGAGLSVVLSDGNHQLTATASDSDGASGSDSVSVTVGTPTGGGITLSGNSYKVKGRVQVDLSWADASGSQVEIRRDGVVITTTSNDGAYTDNTGLKGSGSLTYQICETGGAACSATITINY